MRRKPIRQTRTQEKERVSGQEKLSRFERIAMAMTEKMVARAEGTEFLMM